MATYRERLLAALEGVDSDDDVKELVQEFSAELQPTCVDITLCVRAITTSVEARVLIGKLQARPVGHLKHFVDIIGVDGRETRLITVHQEGKSVWPKPVRG